MSIKVTKVALRRKLINRGRESLYLDFHPAIRHPSTGEETRREFLRLYIFITKPELRKKINDKRNALKKKKEKHITKIQDLHELQTRVNNTEIENLKDQIKSLNKQSESLEKQIKSLGNQIENLEKLYKELKALSPIQKQHNRETLQIAESIRQKRENFLNKPEIYSEYEKEKLRLKKLGERDFVAYFRELANERKASNHDNWMSALKYLESFADGTLKFADLNEKVLEKFKEYLLTTKSNKSDKAKLAQNSALSYFNKVKATLKQAYTDGILQVDLNRRIKPIKAVDTHREYLTIEELTKLKETPCNNKLLKRVALFSALTGLRFSDIQKLTWGEVHYVKGSGYSLRYTQKKTKNTEEHPISDDAVDYMGERGADDEKIFKGLKYSAYNNKHLYQWIGAAGITKDITFHCFRHTYATLQLYNGTDITVVSKLLGHRDLKTTLIYAKIVDKAKREAANKIKF